MIRVRTFLKYAGTHLQEARIARKENHPALVISRCSDMAIALIKAIAAAIPGIKKDFLKMDDRALSKVISDIVYTPDDAIRIAKNILELENAAVSCGGVPSREDAETVFYKAEEVFETVRKLLGDI
jgi:HEPN domain-containing protein